MHFIWASGDHLSLSYVKGACLRPARNVTLLPFQPKNGFRTAKVLQSKQINESHSLSNLIHKFLVKSVTGRAGLSVAADHISTKVIPLFIEYLTVTIWFPSDFAII